MTAAVVVYESLFGDAERIARAIADGLTGHLDAEVIAAKDAPPSFGSELQLLVVGGPNHAMSMPRPATREDAVKKYGAEVPDPTVGLHEWLDRARPLHGVQAAAFDTRMDRPRLVTALDHAARTEEKLLHKVGATLAAPAERFHVVDAKGPLADGEEDRARQWGAALAEIVTAGSRR
jgi:flavodoxin